MAKMHTMTSIDEELKDYALQNKINLSELLEKAIQKLIDNKNETTLDLTKQKNEETGNHFETDILKKVASMEIISRKNLIAEFGIDDPSVIDQLILEATRYRILNH